MRFCYNLIIHLFSPLILWIAYRHCHKHPQFSLPHCWQKRRGINLCLESGGLLVHAISAGETRLAFSILKRLSNDYPKLPLTLTNGSLNGAEQVSLYQADFTFQHTMLPLDYPLYVNRFMQQIQPRLVIIMETELWPNLYHYCYQRGIKIILLNTRLTKKTYQWYQYASFGKKLFNYVHWIGAQSQQDRQRILDLGVNKDKVGILGNIKSLVYDQGTSISDNDEWRKWRKHYDYCWVAGSVYFDELHMILQAYAQLHRHLREQKNNTILLVLVPRKPKEFSKILEAVRRYCQQQKWHYVRYSDFPQPMPEVAILVIDKMGYLSQIYCMADIAFVGGSMIPQGGHNIMEPAKFSVPIVSGMHYYDQETSYRIFLSHQAIEICQSAPTLAQTLETITDQEIMTKWQQRVAQSFQHMQQKTHTQCHQLQAKIKEILN